MLLHRLVEYAERPEVQLPPDYYQSKQIHWVLALDEQGRQGRLLARRPAKGSKERPFVINAPDMYRSGTKPLPFLLVDAAQYVLGHPKPDLPDGESSPKAQQEAVRRNGEYADLIRAWSDQVPGEAAAQAMRRYVDGGGLRTVPVPEDLVYSDTVAVMVGDQWLHEFPSAQRMWAYVVRSRKSGARAQCLVCGQEGDLLATIPASIKPGAIPTSGLIKKTQLVSVNAPAYGRGGALQLVNTPVCEKCGSRAMAALNTLLADPAHRRRGTESVTAWWTREPVEEKLFETLDDPKAETVARLVDSLQNRPGPVAAGQVDANAYYALTLGVNNARVVVRDWLDMPLPELRANIVAWFQDHEVFDGWDGTHRHLPLWLLAAATGRWDPKNGKYAPRTGQHNIDADLLHAAVHGTPVPARLLPHLLKRIRADRRLDAPRIALLRLALRPDRKGRPPMPEPDNTVLADAVLEERSIAHLCGQAFAVLEAIQRSALPNLNTTIGDKFFGTAMTAPAAVFTNLHRGAKAHLKRLRRDRPGAGRALEGRLTEVFAAIGRTGPIPTTLTMRQQAEFILGYERQRAEDNAARAAHKAKKNNDGEEEKDGDGQPE